jgi:hypothetical protein
MAKCILKLCKIAKMLSHIYIVVGPDPGSDVFFFTRDKGWKKNPDPESGMNIFDNFFESL